MGYFSYRDDTKIQTIMERFSTKICYGGGYIIPSLRLIELAHKSVFCASNGQTDNYNSGSIWDNGDDISDID